MFGFSIYMKFIKSNIMIRSSRKLSNVFGVINIYLFIHLENLKFLNELFYILVTNIALFLLTIVAKFKNTWEFIPWNLLFYFHRIFPMKHLSLSIFIFANKISLSMSILQRSTLNRKFELSRSSANLWNFK